MTTIRLGTHGATESQSQCWQRCADVYVVCTHDLAISWCSCLSNTLYCWRYREIELHVRPCRWSQERAHSATHGTMWPTCRYDSPHKAESARISSRMYPRLRVYSHMADLLQKFLGPSHSSEVALQKSIYVLQLYFSFSELIFSSWHFCRMWICGFSQYQFCNIMDGVI